MHAQLTYWLAVQDHQRALAESRVLDTRLARTRVRRGRR